MAQEQSLSSGSWGSPVSPLERSKKEERGGRQSQHTSLPRGVGTGRGRPSTVLLCRLANQTIVCSPMGHGGRRREKEIARRSGPRHRQLITQIYVPIVHCLSCGPRAGPCCVALRDRERIRWKTKKLPVPVPGIGRCALPEERRTKQRTNDREDGRRRRRERGRTTRSKRSRVKKGTEKASVDRLESAPPGY